MGGITVFLYSEKTVNVITNWKKDFLCCRVSEKQQILSISGFIK